MCVCVLVDTLLFTLCTRLLMLITNINNMISPLLMEGATAADAKSYSGTTLVEAC